VSVMEGYSPQVNDNGVQDGVFGGSTQVATGGTWAAQPLGMAIGYQAP
jgi:hypothetical protein